MQLDATFSLSRFFIIEYLFKDKTPLCECANVCEAPPPILISDAQRRITLDCQSDAKPPMDEALRKNNIRR